MKHITDFALITRKASRTFYFTTLLFPKDIQKDVFVLYSFVRTADDLIDQKPPKIREYKKYKRQFERRLAGETIDNEIVDAFATVVIKKKIPEKLIYDFFHSLELDASNSRYKTYEELSKFIYGVADVIGLLMAYVLSLPKESHYCAAKLGHALQLINIIRDIQEDTTIGRTYIPQDTLREFKLSRLTAKEVLLKKIAFTKMIRFEIRKIYSVMKEAEVGYRYIPKKYLFSIKSAAELYKWTADKIYKDPLIIFKKKIKPPLWKILYVLLKNKILLSL